MRVAVISDIHGNAFALDKVISDIKKQGVDQIVCLGDSIQGGPQPAQTVAMLRELGFPIVMGNADAWMLTGVETSKEPTSEARMKMLKAVREWSLTKLSAEDRAFIETFKPTIEIPLEDGRNLLCFHGSPTDFDEILFPTTTEEEFQAALTPYLPSIMTGGHTHMQQIRRIGAADSFFFNPGSVGFAYSHQQPEGVFHADAWAEYAILTASDGQISLELRRLPYDANAIIEIYRASGRPYADEAIGQYSK